MKIPLTISINDLIKDLDKTDVLFFGEEHNDSVGHVLEMEMFHTDVEPIINEYLGAGQTGKNTNTWVIILS